MRRGLRKIQVTNLFFRKGQIGEWKLKLSKEQIKKIEDKFSKEMKELKYI